jgi:hypothetical protein
MPRVAPTTVAAAIISALALESRPARAQDVLTVTGVTSNSGPVGIAIGIGLVAYGSFQLGTTFYEAATGQNPYSGQRSTDDERGDLFARGLGALVGGLYGARGYARGPEFEIPLDALRGPTGKPARVAPWGNRTGNYWGEYPHYHRAIPNPSCPGESLRGQGYSNHRPWQGGF